MFFTYGPVLTMGTLFAQYYPRETHLKLINIVVWTLLFALFEYTVHTNNYLIYTNWSIVDSIELDLVVITALSYVCEILIHPREREREKIV